MLKAKDVIINMRTIQGVDGKGDILDFLTDGIYSHEGGVSCISYEESEVTGMPGTKTSVIVSPGGVVVDRSGPVTSRMEFCEGEKSQFIYSTPYGKATLGLRTRKIDHSFDEAGGHVVIDYDIDVEHTVFAKNKLILDVKPEQKTYA